MSWLARRRSRVWHLDRTAPPPPQRPAPWPPRFPALSLRLTAPLSSPRLCWGFWLHVQPHRLPLQLHFGPDAAEQPSMDSRVLEHPHAQFGGSLGGLVGFPYPLGPHHHHHHHHQHVYELASGNQLQSTTAVPFSIDGLLNGSCSASVVSSNPLLSPDSHQFKLSGRPGSSIWALTENRLLTYRWAKMTPRI